MQKFLEFGRAHRYSIVGEIEMRRAIAILLIVTAVIAISSSVIAQTKTPGKKAEKAIDPVCGLTVDKLPELSYVYKGETYYFCSKADLNKFKETPDKYTKKPASGR
jgi:YHS domain-containing protein